MVKLLRAGEPVKMSKRSGNFVTLADVVREVGKDVVRFMMLTKRADTPLEFDFAKVVEASKDNPVFYVQYAHARMRSLQRKAADAGVSLDAPADLTLLDAEELGLVKMAAQFPRVIESAAMAHEPHRIAFYLYDLAAEFHALWNRGNDDPERRFLIENNPQVSRARLELARGIGQIIKNGLKHHGSRGRRGDALMARRSAGRRRPAALAGTIPESKAPDLASASPRQGRAAGVRCRNWIVAGGRRRRLLARPARRQAGALGPVVYHHFARRQAGACRSRASADCRGRGCRAGRR